MFYKEWKEQIYFLNRIPKWTHNKIWNDLNFSIVYILAGFLPRDNLKIRDTR
jgi:hypothetical protein